MQKQVARYPLDTREHIQLSYAYRAGGDSTDALAQIKAAEALSPTKEDVWTTAGAIEWDVGDLRAAQEAFDKAYALGPEFPAAYYAAGNRSAAIATIRQAVARFPEAAASGQAAIAQIQAGK